MSRLLPFLLVVLAVALFTRVDAFFYLLYVLFGVYVLGRLWSRRALRAVEVRRVHDGRVFQGEPVQVRLEVLNRGRLPVLWLRLNELVPLALGAPGAFRRVVSLAPRERLELDYTLYGERRGYYHIGPLVARSGDLLGTAGYEARPARPDPSPIIVYPRVVPLTELGLPSQSPFGVLRSRQRIFEDPTRLRGVRDYQPGDSLRQIDWKTSGRLQSLQVKRYEPAIALETAIYLNMRDGDYPVAYRSTAPELAIVVAASMAVHLAGKRQAVAITTNGRDPLAVPGGDGDDCPACITPGLPLRKGREHLMHVLDLLARVELGPDPLSMPYLDMVCDKSLALPWGSTAVLITSEPAEGLLDTLLVLRRRGLGVLLVLTCPHREQWATLQRAARIGVRAHAIESERDLDIWR